MRSPVSTGHLRTCPVLLASWFISLLLLSRFAHGADRTYWRNNVESFENNSGTQWTVQSGDKIVHFVEISRTPDYIELLDQQLNFTVRLFSDRFEGRQGNEPFTVRQQGHWEAKPVAAITKPSGEPATPAAGATPAKSNIVTTMDDYTAHEFRGARGKSIPYRLLTPYNYDKSKRYPVVLFLHGFGERGTDNKAQLKYCVDAFIKPEVRADFPCFVLVPQSPGAWVGVPDFKKNQRFEPKPGESLLLAVEAVGQIEKEYAVDPNRIYITGASNGGYGVWELLEREPQRWAAAIPMCGGGDPTHIAGARNVPIWAFHGVKDNTVPIERSREMIATLKSAGGNPKFTEYPNNGHMDSANKAVHDKETLAWLFAQKRP